MTAIIQFRNLSKNYAHHQVLKGLNLDVRAGEFFALVGVNGAGKTTTIKCMLDFCDVSEGEITLFDIPHTQTSARQRLAYLPERFVPPYYLKGEDFLQYISKLHEVAYDRERVESVCMQLDLSPSALDKSVHALSKGMAQKLGLAAILLSPAELYVLDEPMSGLDPKARAMLKAQLLERKKQGLTVFFSTHMLADVEAMCDRMAILHQGELRFLGSPVECMRTYQQADLEHAYLCCVADEK
jgi:ABC-2 type transport system ATP-binding protein